MRYAVRQSVFALCLVFASLVSHGVDASPAIDWIRSTQNADGSYVLTTDVATATQSTAETLSTFVTLDEYTGLGITLAVDYLNAETYLNTENLSRLITANQQTGNDLSALLDTLALYQNFDGGFGELPGYDSTPLDTAFALIAMANARYDDIDVVDSAVTYLVNRQQADGSFILSANNQSSIYITALCSIALQQYRFVFNLSGELQAANDYLLAQQIPDQGWGSLWETAVALQAIVHLTTDTTRYSEAVRFLRTGQQANGSWANDVFTTALAARALHLVDTIRQPVAPTAGVVRGRIVRDATLAPLSSVQVTIDELPSMQALSDSDGRFTLTGLAASTYTVRYQGGGSAPATQTISIEAGQVADLGAVRLAPAADSGLISGMITSNADGSPVAGANITVTGAFTASASADAGGSYSVSGATGDVRISVIAAGFDPAVVSAVVTAGGTLTFSPSLIPSGTAIADPAVSITGSVLDAESRQPVTQASIEVSGSGQAASTATSGAFMIDNLVAGEFTVSITHRDYQTRHYQVAALAGSAINLGVIGLDRSANRSQTTTVTGVVTDADSGQALAGASVAVVESGVGRLTDANGRYRFEQLNGNQFTVTASATGYFGATRTVSVAEPARVDLDLSLNRASASSLDIIDMHIETGITNYSALSEIEADAILYNSGNTDCSVRMYYKVVNAADRIVAEGPVSAIPVGADPSSVLLTIPAGQAVETEIEWYNGTSPAGDYRLIAQAYHSVTGQLLAERGISVTVESTNRIGGAAEFDPPIVQFASGTPVQLGAIVRNAGNQVIEPTALTARLLLNRQGYQARKDLAEVDASITDSGFEDTRGMAIDGNGNVYVVNSRRNTVSRIDTGGTVTTIADSLDIPVDIDIASDGDLFILNRNGSYVRIDTGGTRTKTHTGLVDQVAIESLTDGRVMITQGDALYSVLPDGSIDKLISGGLAGPHDMVVNSQGDVFIASTDDDSISRYANGTLSTFVAGINKPYGLAVDANDHLIVTSYGDNSLLRITPDGAVSVIATGLSGPFDVLTDRAGRYIVSNAMSNQIISIDPSGTRQTLVDQTIHKPAAALYSSSGDLFVANTGFGNIVKFSNDGMVAEFAADIADPVALLDGGDGGVEVLQADGSIVNISASGARTTVASGLSSPKAFVHDPEGDGYMVVESLRNRITHQHADGQTSVYADGLLDSVRAMTVSASGDVYLLAGASGDRLLIRISADKTTEVIARGMPFTGAMAIDGAGNVYVTDYTARQVLRVDTGGNSTVVADTPFYPGAITVTANGDVLLAPFGGNAIYALNADGSLTQRITVASSIMYGLVEDTSGNLWTSDQNSGTVSRISPANIVEHYSVQTAGALQADNSGGIYVGAYGSIKRIDSTGAVSSAISHDAIAGVVVSTFAIDRKGAFWVPDAKSITYLFDDASNLLQRFTTLKRPTGMVTDANGDLVVTNGNNTVVRIRGRGALPEVITTGSFNAIARENADTALVTSGGAARRLDLATGSMSLPIPYSSTPLSSVKAIAVRPTGGFVLADHSQNRLHVYDASDVEVDVQVGIVNPRGLALDATGRILVANTEPKGIAAVRTDRRAEAYLYDFNGFDYLLTKADGNIFAASRRDGTITEFDRRKRVVRTLVVPESDALAIDANGELLSAMRSEGALIRISTDGSNSFERLASGLSHANDVETNSAGDVYLTDGSRSTILKLHADGSLSLDAPNIQGASWLSFSPNGDKLVTYAGNRLALFEADGTRIELPLTNIVDHGMQFGGLAVDQSGAIYVSTTVNNAVLKLHAQVTQPAIETGQAVHRASVQLDRLPIGGQVAVDFGDWTPERGGEYLVEITADNGVTGGTLRNTLHVGARADGQLVVTDTKVPPGDQVISSVLTIDGADPTQFTRIETQNLTLAATTYARLGRGITADSHGNVYASDAFKIVKVTPDGAISDFVTGIDEGIGWAGMVTDNTDTLFAPSMNGLVLKFTPDGQKSTIGTFPSSVEAVALDYNDQLYAVTSAGKLYKVDKASGVTTELPAEGLRAPRGMTIDGYGNIYVLNRDISGTGTDPIIRITPTGKSTNVFDYANFEFEGIPLTADCSNNLLFAPIKLPPIKHYGEEDIIVQLIGETGEVSTILHGPAIAPGLGDIDVIAYDRFANRLLFYTDWYNGEIFSFPIICGGIGVSAHLVTRADVDLSSADPAPARILDRYDGTREYIWQLSDVDNKGLAIQLNLRLRGLAEGEQRPIVNEAFLEFSNSFNPDRAVQVALDIPVVLASSQVSIVSSVDAAQYEADSMVDIAIEVANDSDTIFDGAVDVNVVDANGEPVETLPSIAVNALSPQSSVRLASVWNTGITLAGDYAVFSSLKNAAGEIIASSTAMYRILAGSRVTPVVTASVSTTKTRYLAWDSVGINARVRNTSNNAIQGKAVVTLTVTDSSGAVVHTDTAVLNALYPGSYTDVGSGFELVDAAAGRYRVALVSHDAATGAALAQAAYDFDVERMISQGVAGKVDARLRQLDTTETNICTETVTNLSATAINGLTVRHLLVDVASGITVDSREQSVDLAAGAALSFSQTISPNGSQPGVYACVLQIDIDGHSRTLGTAGFEYTKPERAFDIAFKLGVGSRGRLLLLLDPPDWQALDHDDEYPDAEDVSYRKDKDHANQDTPSLMSDDDADRDDKPGTESELARDHDSDPHGPAGAPLLSLQRNTIESLLRGNGWSFTVVESSEAFTEAMRSGIYSAFALFSEHVTLSAQVQRELIEAVYRGEGLLVSGDHDGQNAALHEALGIKSKGRHDRVSGIALTGDARNYAVNVLFDLNDSPQRISATRAEVIATYTGIVESAADDEDGDGEGDDQTGGTSSWPGNAAVTRSSYGGGVAVWIGFDLLAELASTDPDVVLAGLLVDALSDIDQAATHLSEGGLIPVKLELSNHGAAAMGKVSLTLPPDARLLDSLPLAKINTTDASWLFDLTLDSAAIMAVWLQMPPSAALAEFDGQLQVGVGPNLEDFDRRQLSLTFLPKPTLAEIEARLASRASQHEAFGDAEEAIGKAIDLFEQNHVEAAIKKALKAIDKLNLIDSDEMSLLRLDIARAIRVLAMHWTPEEEDED